MLFSVNQASHLYVAKRVPESDSVVNVGDILFKTTDDNKNMYFSYMGEGGLIRSDLIPVKNVMHFSAKTADELRIPLKKATVVLNSEVSTTPIAGEDYILRIKYSIGSIDNQYIKYGAVRAFAGDTPSTFYKKMYDSLVANFKRETESVFEFSLEGTEDAYTGIAITEVEPKWVLGTYPQRPIDFEISVDTVESKAKGVEGPWGVVTIETPKAKDLNENNSYPNSKKIADFEWFCMGERGDQYKNYGWPNVIPTKYMIDHNSAEFKDGYDVINIHYSYVGSNESVQKSEKDIFIVVPKSAHDTVTLPIRNAIRTLISE